MLNFNDLSRLTAVVASLILAASACSNLTDPVAVCPPGTMQSGDQCIPSSDRVLGCTSSEATNYNPDATVDDGSCTIPGFGCTNPTASNYDPSATTDDGSCLLGGCTNQGASNFDATATQDDGSCRFVATFAVNLAAITTFNPADGVFVHGTFNEWCETCAPLADDDSDGVYTGEVEVAAGSQSFRFVIGSDPIVEEVVPDECSVPVAGNTPARSFDMPAQAFTVPFVAFAACSSVTLPMPVDSVYAPSGFMGDGETGSIVASETCPTRAGDEAGLCHQFTYTPGALGWSGVFWQYPENNWGTQPGFPVPAGATRVNFWAWGENGGELVTFLAGISAADGFGLETAEFPLTATPTEYQIMLVGVTYDEIVGAFGYVTPTPVGGGAVTIYVDDIQYQEVPEDLVGDRMGCTDSDAENYDAQATIDDGTCQYNVTFEVDMSCAGVAFTTVLISGPFCEWCANGFALEDEDSDGVYTGTFAFPSGPLEFKYMVDDFAAQEDLIDDVIGGNGTCAPITDSATYANRQVTVADAPTTTTDTYGRCDACP